MKKFILWLVFLCSCASFANRELIYKCKNEEYKVTLHQIFSDKGKVVRLSLVIRNDEHDLYSFSNNGRKTDLALFLQGDQTIVASIKVHTLLSHFTIKTIKEPSERYEATLVLNEGEARRTIEFSECEVSNVLIAPPPYQNPEPYHTRTMR